MSERTYTLTASCPDQVGIVARVSQFLAELGGWILETNFHAEPPDEHNPTGRFFMRLQIRASSLALPLVALRQAFGEQVAQPLGMTWHLSDSAVKKRVVILVSKQEHCLYDLLARWQAGELDVEIPCVISNHDTLRGIVEWHGIPFLHVPITKENRATAFAEIERLFNEVKGDVMVLARFMQILPPDLCLAYAGQILNIHHSFLPSFVGARPYHQAWQRGVKLIGATCHYVTPELDQGPIIEQDVIRVDHTDTPEAMVRYGKDIEKAVLARGLRYHIEDRVLIHGARTIVFR
jgi:formyltetrahydrofolate deformylase